MEEKIILDGKKTTISQKAARYGLIIIGSFLFVLLGYFVEGNNIYLLKTIAIFILIPPIANPFSIFGQYRELILTEEYVKGTEESIHFIEFLIKRASRPKTAEDMTVTRTAYWDSIKEAYITRHSLRVYYNSGIYENFRIPYLDQDEYEELLSKIKKKCEEHGFPLEEKKWWEIPY